MPPFDYIASITDRYQRLGYQTYRWFRAEEPPAFVPLSKPLSECKLGVVSTAGVYVKGQVAYCYKDDISFRAIPKSTPVSEIRFSHITENYLPDARRDANCVFPIEPLRRLEAEGVVGQVADELFSCMGGIYSQRRVREELIPALTAEFARQEVDVVLLVPL